MEGLTSWIVFKYCLQLYWACSGVDVRRPREVEIMSSGIVSLLQRSEIAFWGLLVFNWLASVLASQETLFYPFCDRGMFL